MKRVGRRNNYWSKVTIELACTVETDGNSHKTVTLKETFSKIRGTTVFQSEYFFRITNRSSYVLCAPKLTFRAPIWGAPHILLTPGLGVIKTTKFRKFVLLPFSGGPVQI
jgi:hypothetical protein